MGDKCFVAFLLKFFPMGKTNALREKNFKLPAEFNGIHPRGVGEATRLHSSLPAPWDGELARALELLREADAHVEGACRCRC